MGGVVESRVLDLFGPDPLLPIDGDDIDLVLVADVLYNQELGMQVGRRIMDCSISPRTDALASSLRIRSDSMAPTLRRS